jgi:uncharacterized protein (TIGR03435 family)
MGELAELLGERVGMRGFDRTGVAGRYDFTFAWDPAPARAADRRERDAAAMLESLRAAGFDLVRLERERDVLVVDRIEPPTLPALLRR